ncbi:hypothetical protein GCM10027436_41310 [Actinophytocola sediminis]
MSGELTPGVISGYVDADCQWIYSVWNGSEWVDVGRSRAAALEAAARIPQPRRPRD